MKKRIFYSSKKLIVLSIFILAIVIFNGAASFNKANCAGSNCYEQCQQDYLDCVNSGGNIYVCRDERTACFENCS